MAFPAPSTAMRGPTSYAAALSIAYWGTWLKISSPGEISVNLDDSTIAFTVKVRIGEDGDDATIDVPASGQWYHNFPRGGVVYLNVLSASGTPNAQIVVGG